MEKAFIDFAKTIKMDIENRMSGFELSITPDRWHEGASMIKVSYGDLSYEFTTAGYNYTYNCYRLMNNDVMKEILR